MTKSETFAKNLTKELYVKVRFSLNIMHIKCLKCPSYVFLFFREEVKCSACKYRKKKGRNGKELNTERNGGETNESGGREGGGRKNVDETEKPSL